MKIRTDDPLYYIHNHGIDINNNEIYLVGEDSYVNGVGVEEAEEPGVEFLMANKFIKNLSILSHNSDDPITIKMKTNGGDWSEGVAIYDAIKSCKNEVTIINYTHARSMSSIIFLAGDKRLMHKHSSFMFHGGTIYTGGTVRQFRTEYKQNEIAHKQMMEIYVNHLKDKPYWKGKTERQIHNWLEKQMKEHEEVYLSAEEAVEYGFADEIIEHY